MLSDTKIRDLAKPSITFGQTSFLLVYTVPYWLKCSYFY